MQAHMTHQAPNCKQHRTVGYRRALDSQCRRRVVAQAQSANQSTPTKPAVSMARPLSHPADSVLQQGAYALPLVPTCANRPHKQAGQCTQHDVIRPVLLQRALHRALLPDSIWTLLCPCTQVFPASYDQAIRQAQESVKAAIADGHKLIEVAISPRSAKQLSLAHTYTESLSCEQSSCHERPRHHTEQWQTPQSELGAFVLWVAFTG